MTGGRAEDKALVGSAAFGYWQAKFASNDIRTLDERHHLEEGVAAAHSFSTHTAIGGNHEPLGGNEFQRNTNMVGDLFGPLDLKCVVINDADANLLVRSDGFSNGF